MDQPTSPFTRATTASVVDGVGGELSGSYLVTFTDEGLVLSPTGDGNTIVLRPRHRWLKSSEGIDVDSWTVCNVFVSDSHKCIARCALPALDHLDIILEV